MDLEAMAAALEASGDYRVLRKLKPPEGAAVFQGAHRIGLFVDVETTGLDVRTDEIIELAMVRFAYDEFGQILGIGECFQGFRQPTNPIPAEITALTGITDEMVAGHVIDPAAVAAFASSAAVVVAHNAAFDRQFLERFCDVFHTKPWACSMSQVDWAGEGFEGTKLTYLASGAGFFYDKHRAVNDCVAAIELLTRVLPKSGVPAWWRLIERARLPSWRIRAEGAPFDLKDALKARGYRWDDGSGDWPRAWWIDVEDAGLESELGYLRREIYQGEVDLRPMKVTAYDRFSERC